MANGRNGGRRVSQKARIESRYPVAYQSAAFESNISANMDAFTSEMSEKAFRSAAHQGALLAYDALKANTPVQDPNGGTLRDSIYRKHVSVQSGPYKQVYQVGPNKKKAPHWHLPEYGYMQPYVVVRLGNGQWRTTKKLRAQPKFIAPKPYLRPTFAATSQRSLDRMRDTLKQRIAEISRGIKP